MWLLELAERDNFIKIYENTYNIDLQSGVNVRDLIIENIRPIAIFTVI